MPEMANPAVIIGLGGTGKWVLTYVKKNLLDTYGGEMPKAVRLLSFDTISEKVGQEGLSQEETVQVGDVQLDKQAEFIYLGGNIQQICREIRDQNQHPHLQSWLQARTYLQIADSDAFDISRGAGQKRPFGRMAIFYDLQQTVQSKITNKIETAIREVVGANKYQEPVEIYIVASMAGGTGSGMFIDVAHLVRWFAHRQIRTGFAVRGFLALHNTFRSVIKTEHVQPQVFAAIRELDRFMLVFDQQYPIIYNPSNPTLQTIYGGQLGKLFDNCYLLDASREHMPLDNHPPKYGVLPSVADCITMLLDTSTGDAYAQHYKNVNTRIAELQSKIDQPIYSSFGTYSLILPIEDIITSLTYRFAIDLLSNHLLNLDRRVNDSGHVQFTLRNAGNMRKDTVAFLRSPKSPSGVVSTNFIQRIAIAVDGRNTNDNVYIADTAELETAELLIWMLPPEADPTIEELAQSIRADLEVLLMDRVQPSDIVGDDPLEGSTRILRGVRDFRAEYLGHDTGGRRVGGLYRNAIERCMLVHRDRYRILLQEHVLHMLNGSDPTNKDYQLEKRGRLGHAQALLSQLSAYLVELSNFLARVQEHRAQQDELRGAQEAAALCRSEMESKRNAKGALGVFVRGWQPSVRAQHVYLDAEQRVIDIEIKDLFFDFLRQTSDALRHVTEEIKATVDAWVATLVTGLSGAVNDPGLCKYLAYGAAQHTANREEKRRIVVHEYLTDESYETGLYQAIADSKAAEALTGLVWGIEHHQGMPRLTLSSCTLAGTGPVGGRSATERNAEYFWNIAHGYFTPLRELTIADRLLELSPQSLADMLLEKCGPLVHYDPSKTGGELELHYFVCVNEGRQKAYFNEFRDTLQRLGASAKDNQILKSSNPYTCNILATADAITSSSLLAYAAAEREYNNYTGDARLLHIFPAEGNAVELEQQLPRIREPRRRFSPILTTMLEDRKAVELFIRTFLYRFIRLEEADSLNRRRWMLCLPSSLHRDDDRYALTTVERQPSLFRAMECFIFRKSDISNTSRKIDFQLLEQELRAYEDRVSGGDESRLINLLETMLESSVTPLQRSSESALFDLGSLMRLVVGEFVEDLHNRIKVAGKAYNPEAQPLLSLQAAPPEIVMAPGEHRNGLMKTMAPVDAIMMASNTGPFNARDKLKELKQLLDEGLISSVEYESKRQEILNRM